ncbi:hypothetical protein B0T22DRAFT_478701 [Podospora appendiculata]|uniref:Uncharacterized protein n=1 Tax=Podospora appendiculata TaxID=314037 RepID=A0AAE1CBD0_9PEZI|nr:hypothetical protein B0T22DRAFT_478701 [Podospora appendiculata]
MAASLSAVLAHLAEHEDDENASQRGYVNGTDFALPYISQWSRLSAADIQHGLFRHVNCGYLSTEGVAPTLLALKQHAQSLCALIHALNPTLKSAEILTGVPNLMGPSSDQGSVIDEPTTKYHRGDAFDFLTDLSKPYQNDDPNHNKPLTALLNEVRGRNELTGTEYHCPLVKSKPREKGEDLRPYANHHALVMHANACLERLDHEYSSTGGLLSLLPTAEPHDDEQLKNARNSLLGQFLFFTHQLVGRMHELERSYGNALDALAGEAAIPYQYLAGLGADGRSGRQIAYPQDRWILANAGDDVFEYVHNILDRQEAIMQAKEKVWRDNGVVGETEADSERARGIVHVNIMTRYYRLAGRGRNTIFVLPAWDHHPAVAHTRQIESEPTVVSSVQPKFPQRATELEKLYNERLRNAQLTEMDNLTLQADAQQLKTENDTLVDENHLLRETNKKLSGAVGRDSRQLAEDLHGARNEANKAKEKASRAQQLKDAAEAARDQVKSQVEVMVREVARLKAQLAAQPAVEAEAE